MRPIWKTLLIGLRPHGGAHGFRGCRGCRGAHAAVQPMVVLPVAINTNCAITSTLNKP